MVTDESPKILQNLLKRELLNRVLNFSRPALQIPITLFLAFTFPHFPTTLRYRRITLLRGRRGI